MTLTARRSHDIGTPTSGGALVVENVSVSYGRIPALWNVSLTVDSGGCVALVGPNGAGKTTLLRAIGGLVRPTSGSITYCGRNLVGLRPHSVAEFGVAFVQEGRGVFSRLTVRENLRLAAELAKVSDVNQVLDYFPVLRQRQAQIAGTLSGGEQQMLALSLAMVSRPKLMLIDEPSLGLAPRVVQELFAVFDSLRQDGVGMLIVEQFVHMVARIADKVDVLQKGRVVTEVSSQEITAEDSGLESVIGAYLGGTGHARRMVSSADRSRPAHQTRRERIEVALTREQLRSAERIALRSGKELRAVLEERIDSGL